jgi:hypothetical protein
MRASWARWSAWSHRDIVAKIGEVRGYVADRGGAPLVITDDDLSGTFTFIRALEDHGFRPGLTAEEIGRTWLNYLIENRTILWWGGLGNSTEHTAYLRLAAGIPAPRSGSIELNGRVVAEQIGAQIFIDGWAMVCPGDPERAAALADRAASVSHDGEARGAARLLAAMEAQAFVEPDLERLIETGLRFVPPDSLIARMIADLRAWHRTDGDWRKTRERIEAVWGYATYGGNCHVIPNHALIHLALLYGGGDLMESLMIVNTCGWDTDCNSGNVGCLLGIRGGLAAFEGAYDWRGPVGDRLFLPTADGARCVTDALREADALVRAGAALAGAPYEPPKDGARYHFSMPGSVQGWTADGGAAVANEPGPDGGRALAIRGRGILRAGAAVFTDAESARMPGYALVACPALHPGQTVRARVVAPAGKRAAALVRLYAEYHGPEGSPVVERGPAKPVAPGEAADLEWRVPDLGGAPVFRIGIEAEAGGGEAAILLDRLGWDGEPDCAFPRPPAGARLWLEAWVNGADHVHRDGELDWRVIQDRGRGLVIRGGRDWRDVRAAALVRIHMAAAGGLAVRVQGMRRYNALLLRPEGRLQLVRVVHDETVLVETPFPVETGRSYALSLAASGDRLVARVDGETVADVRDPGSPLDAGGIAMIAEEGRVHFGSVEVRPN